MKGSFVFTFRIKPPSGVTLMVRDGANVFDAYHCRWRNKWFMLLPGGREEAMPAAPQFFWLRDCDRQSLSAEAAKEVAKPVEMPVINRRGQMMLSLGRVA
jgi:hypothetical protein